MTFCFADKIVLEFYQVTQCLEEAQTHYLRPGNRVFKRIEKPLEVKITGSKKNLLAPPMFE
jgi:hypothetical protein